MDEQGKIEGVGDGLTARMPEPSRAEAPRETAIAPLNRGPETWERVDARRAQRVVSEPEQEEDALERAWADLGLAARSAERECRRRADAAAPQDVKGRGRWAREALRWDYRMDVIAMWQKSDQEPTEGGA